MDALVLPEYHHTTSLKEKEHTFDEKMAVMNSSGYGISEQSSYMKKERMKCMAKQEYEIYAETPDKKKKKEYWETAIGLQQVDALEPSEIC